MLSRGLVRTRQKAEVVVLALRSTSSPMAAATNDREQQQQQQQLKILVEQRSQFETLTPSTWRQNTRNPRNPAVK
jgi:hypothetical protein